VYPVSRRKAEVVQPLHWSQLKEMAESPAHYRYRLDHPIEPTPVMKFGSLVHAMVLNKAPRSFVVYEGKRGNSKLYTKFKADHAGLEIVTADEWERASNCADAVKADPVCGPLLKSGLREQQIEWVVDSRQCSGTPDVSGTLLVDLKVTAMAPRRFPWHCRKMLWHAQLAWYMNGLDLQETPPVSNVYIITVPPKPPHIPVAYYLTERTLETGATIWRSLFDKLMQCEKDDQWPGYAQDVVALDLDEIDDEPLDLIMGDKVVTL